MTQERARRISFLVNNPDSWAIPYAKRLAEKLADEYEVMMITKNNDLPEGDIAFFLSCSKIVPPELLARHKRNIVIHASELPKGKGFSPIAWQVLEGKNQIPIAVFEAVETLDAGDVYFRNYVELDGSELLDEMHFKLWKKIEELVYKFIKMYPDVKGIPQEGEESFYPRRTEKDDELDPNKTIAEQFNHLRVVDNEHYPAWFVYKGHKYIFKIYKRGRGV